MVAEDVAGYRSTWNTEGVEIAANTVDPGNADPDRFFDGVPAVNECELVDSSPYEDPLYTGVLHSFTNCPGGSTSAIVLLATDDTASVEIVVQAQVLEGNEDVFTAILESFVV